MLNSLSNMYYSRTTNHSYREVYTRGVITKPHNGENKEGMSKRKSLSCLICADHGGTMEVIMKKRRVV